MFITSCQEKCGGKMAKKGYHPIRDLKSHMFKALQHTIYRVSTDRRKVTILSDSSSKLYVVSQTNNGNWRCPCHKGSYSFERYGASACTHVVRALVYLANVENKFADLFPMEDQAAYVPEGFEDTIVLGDDMFIATKQLPSSLIVNQPNSNVPIRFAEEASVPTKAILRREIEELRKVNEEDPRIPSLEYRLSVMESNPSTFQEFVARRQGRDYHPPERKDDLSEAMPYLKRAYSQHNPEESEVEEAEEDLQMPAADAHIVDWATFYLAKGYSLVKLPQFRVSNRKTGGRELPKFPLMGWAEFMQTPPTLSLVERWWKTRSTGRIALITGYNGLTVIDFDTQEVFGEFCGLMTEAHPEFMPYFEQNPFVQTARGFHAYMIAKEPPSNTVLARDFVRDDNGDAVLDIEGKKQVFHIIDVRGSGGLVVAPPSEHDNGTKYTWLGSDKFVVPKVSADLLEKMFEVARSLDKTGD